MPPSFTSPLHPDITPPAIQKQKKIIGYVTHLQADDTSLIPTDSVASAAHDHEKLSDLTCIRSILATSDSSSPSSLPAKDIAEMRSFISLIPLISGKSWTEALPFLSNVEDPLKEVVGDLLQYREELAEEDVEKIGGVEIGTLKLEGAMAIMEVMRMADEDELKDRKRRLEAVKAAKALEAEEIMDTMAILQREDEMDDGELSLQRDQSRGEDATNVLLTDEQAVREAIVDALVDVQHEEEKAESAEAEFQQLQAQIERDVEARSLSEERQLCEENKTPEEAVAPKKDVENLKGKGRSERRQLRPWKGASAAAASSNDQASRVSRSPNPMENNKLAEVITQKKMKSDAIVQMKKEENGEDKAEITAQIKDEANAVKAAKVGERPAQKPGKKKRMRPTEDIRSGVKVKKQKI